MKDDITVSNWNDLAKFGIGMLTGEACRHSMRLLCDLNEKGRELMAEYLGVDASAFPPAWNTQVDGQPAVGAVMLHRGSLLEVAEFAMFHTGARAIVRSGTGVLGLYDLRSFKLWESYDTKVMGHEFRRNVALTSPAPGAGSRNMHMATGRVA